jgi:hypothetical protein
VKTKSNKPQSEFSAALAWIKQNISKQELCNLSIGEILSQYRAQKQIEQLTK